MEHAYLHAFLLWAEKHGVPQRGDVTENPAARIDFETAGAIARITYWSSGHCDAEVIDFDTELMLYQKHWDDLFPQSFDHEFVDFFNALNESNKPP